MLSVLRTIRNLTNTLIIIIVCAVVCVCVCVLLPELTGPVCLRTVRGDGFPLEE